MSYVPGPIRPQNSRDAGAPGGLPPPPPPPGAGGDSIAEHATPTATPTSITTANAAGSRPAPLPPTIHKRTYQACIPCRQRKVRCDLGSVEAPHDPPCVRCRRESKECYFSATRRKSRAAAEIVLPGLGRGRGVLRKREDELELDGGLPKRPRTVASPGEISDSGHSVTQGYSQDYAHTQSCYSPPAHGFQAPIDPRLQSPHPAPRRDDPSHAAASTSNTTDTILQTEVYNSHEALLTLIEAAGKDTPLSAGPKSHSPHSETTDHEDDDFEDHSPLPPPSARISNVRFSSIPSDEGQVGSHASSYAHRRTASSSTVSPMMTGPGFHRGMSTSTVHEGDKEGMEKALRAWNKFRFVKAGWFTAREAVQFVEYFYHHLHPLSPTLTSPNLLHISHPTHHPQLLRNEPFLTSTILTVASRYLVLPGPGGHSRSYAIHDMLWREVRGGFERLMWGGGWGGLGQRANMTGLNAASGNKVGRGLRTLGTVEGLLILTEWHVRGLHFPMDVEEGDWGIDISEDEDSVPGKEKDERSKKAAVVEGLNDRIENILEPAYRSDRMSWMLLGNALALAYELGVFDEIDDSPTTPPHTSTFSTCPDQPNPPSFRLRAQRIQKLLLVYVLQLASRLGWTSMIPRHITHAVRHKLGQDPPGLGGTWKSEDELQDVVFRSWVDLTMLMKSSAEMLFPSRSYTKSIMRTGRYVSLLVHFQPLLRNWKQEFERLGLPRPIRYILTMEYEHVRFYINSLALQAVVDRCTCFNSEKSGGSNGGSNGGRSFAALMQRSSQDVEFIKEVVDASRALLSCVVEKMWPGGFLRHAPVRIYLRILSASMFLLKTFALGAKEEDVALSINLIDRTIHALRAASVDDVHIGLGFADLLETLTKRIKSRFVRMSRSRAHSPAPTTTSSSCQPSTSLPAFVSPPPLLPLTTPPTILRTPNGSAPPIIEEKDIPGGAEFIYPPTTAAGETEFGNADEDGGFWIGGYEDWLALPIDPLVGAGYGGVTQTQMGPDVGGVDLLELLLGGGG
ncbi:zinc finger transcriptional activator [Rhizina undulata]